MDEKIMNEINDRSDDMQNAAENAVLTDKENENVVPEAELQPESVRKKEVENSARMNLYDWVQCIVSALLCGILIFLFIGRIIGVDGSSMQPTLHHGDRIIISNMFYTPEYGDIVVLQTNTFGEEPIVKRIIATEGQEIDIDFATGTVTVDGEVLQEDYIADKTFDPEDFVGPVTVPDGCVFVMGDNRNASTDSRSELVGMVDERCIMGKVYLLIMPGQEESGEHNWSRIGSVY